jgi:hypothetical protein
MPVVATASTYGRRCGLRRGLKDGERKFAGEVALVVLEDEREVVQVTAPAWRSGGGGPRGLWAELSSVCVCVSTTATSASVPTRDLRSPRTSSRAWTAYRWSRIARPSAVERAACGEVEELVTVAETDQLALVLRADAVVDVLEIAGLARVGRGRNRRP